MGAIEIGFSILVCLRRRRARVRRWLAGWLAPPLNGCRPASHSSPSSAAISLPLPLFFQPALPASTAGGQGRADGLHRKVAIVVQGPFLAPLSPFTHDRIRRDPGCVCSAQRFSPFIKHESITCVRICYVHYYGGRRMRSTPFQCTASLMIGPYILHIYVGT